VSLEDIDNIEDDDIAEVVCVAKIAEISTSFPAIVVSYDQATERAVIQPIIRGRRYDPDTETLTSYRPPKIAEVPVARGMVSTPLQEGWTVWVDCGDRSIEEFKSQGGDDITAQNTRRHDRKDAVIVGRIRALNDAPSINEYAPDGPVLFGDTVVYLGDSQNTEFVALANLVLDRLNAIRNTFNTHTHPAPGGTTSATLTPIAAIDSVAATKTRAR